MDKLGRYPDWINPLRALSLFTSLAAGLLVTSAFAASETPVTLEKYEVTGSHIKRSDIEGSLPVFVMDRAAIDQSGATTVNELFGKVIYNSAGIVDEKFTQGFAPASAGIDLRGLGVSRTLVLVNGRRVPQFPFGQDGSSSFVDINLIPLGLVERVEILKDGASAIYGSDAIAGVVNFITKKGDGLEFDVFASQPFDSGGELRRLGVSWGETFSRGRFGCCTR